MRPNEQVVAGVPRNKLADLLLTLVAMAESSATKQKCVVVVDTFDARVRDKDQAPEFLRQYGLG